MLPNFALQAEFATHQKHGHRALVLRHRRHGVTEISGLSTISAVQSMRLNYSIGKNEVKQTMGVLVYNNYSDRLTNPYFPDSSKHQTSAA